MTTARYIVRSGPSAGRIWDSAKYTFDERDARVPVRFTIENGESRMMVKFRILGVSHVIGASEYDLEITGYIRQLTTTSVVKMLYRANGNNGPLGYIEFEK